MANLIDFTFSNKSDNANSDSGWFVDAGQNVQALDGNDTITSINSGGNYGIFNFAGTLNTGAGNDVLTGSGYAGIYNYRSTLDAGAGNDVVTGSGGHVGIMNYAGTLNTGAGNDVVTGRGNEDGIYNSYDSSINTGDGDDTVDALAGGFGGSGFTNLGSGDDNLKGFGTGFFDGGDGTDVVTFNSGTYSIEDLGAGNYLIGRSMNLTNFEAFGVGADQTSFLAAAAIGTVTFA